VRETFATDDGETFWYRADSETHNAGLPWKPSIHMPRKASRIALNVTEVRIERLQDISVQDAQAEGLLKLNASGRFVVEQGDQYFGLADSDPREVFKLLWERINGEGSWGSNPWVWAVEFRRIEAQR
jgi:hypothetical protein